MFGNNKKRDGKQIIADSVCAFEDTIEELQEGIDLCAEDTAVLNTEIKEREDKKIQLNASVSKAQAVQANIRKFLS